MKERNQTVRKLALGIILALSLNSNARAGLTPELQARMEETIQRLRQSVSNMVACAAAFRAERAATNLPSDLQPIAAGGVPGSVDIFFSMARWPGAPPSWINCWDTNADLYYSPSWGTNCIFVDDRASAAARLLSQAADYSLEDADGGSGYGPTPDYPDYSTNTTDLWLSLDSFTNAGDGMTYFFTIHNVTPGYPYELISSTNVAAPMNPTYWYSEGVWLADSTNLAAYVPTGGKTNRNFFRAHLWTDFIYGVPTNGQIFMQSATNNIYPVVNGATNHLTPFWSNWFVLNPRPTNIYALNLGYDANDGGLTNAIINTNPPQQVLRFAGFSKTVTNLCISSNHITSLNVSGWPALQSVDAWHCISNLNVSVTNCPELRRACFEAIQGVAAYGITNVLDFSGCTHLAEIRAADNRFPNVLITNGAGPEVWHLCIHDNNQVNQLPSNFNFSVFPSLRELWIWNNQFAGPLPLTTANSTNLTSVEAFDNKFTSLDVTGQTNLDHVYIYQNYVLTNLIVTGCTKLKQVNAQHDGLSQASVDNVLVTCDGTGIVGGGAFITINGGSNAVPSLDGQRAAANLMNKFWTVQYNLPPVGTPEITSVAIPVIGSNSVTITWTTDVASDSTVYYSTAFSTVGATYSSTNVGGSVTSHSVTVTGLTAATNYYFFVHSTSGGLTGISADYQFTTRGGPGIYFVHTSTNVVMQVAVTGSPAISWLWADGSATVGVAAAGHGFTNAGISSVVVNPASAVTAFGLYCGGTDGPTTLDNVTGLTNYPNLQELHLYQSGLTNVSLAGCSNLVSIALVSTSPSTNVCNGWFNDVWDAQHTLPGGHTQFSSCGNTNYTFYFPGNPSTNATSAVACSNLVRIGWRLVHYP